MKTVAEKLLIKPNTTVWSSQAAHLGLVGPLPDNVRVVDGIDQATTALLFADTEATLRSTLARHGDRLARLPFVWFLYPKGGRSDLNRDTLWPIVAEHGVRPITQVAVDDTWSALRFRALKESEPPFKGGQ